MPVKQVQYKQYTNLYIAYIYIETVYLKERRVFFWR